MRQSDCTKAVCGRHMMAGGTLGRNLVPGIKRRQFVALLGGAVAWPVAARAQERMRRVGVLLSQASGEGETQVRVAAFVRRLQELGWAEGRNSQIEYRWDAADADSARQYADQLVALTPDVIFASGASIVSALQRCPPCPGRGVMSRPLVPAGTPIVPANDSTQSKSDVVPTVPGQTGRAPDT
jgi:hypothetical protein